MAATTINETRNFNKSHQYHHKNRNHRHNNNNNNNNNNNYNHNNNNNYNNNKQHNKYNKSKILTYDIKIGERNFCLTPESLNHDAPNFFTAAFFGHFYEAKTTSIFIERDPENFLMIVKYLRGYEIDWPSNDKTSMRNLLEDVKFYGFEKLQNLLEMIYEKNFPEKVIPWKILTYTPENEPIVAVNIKDIELRRWDTHSLTYNINPIVKTEEPSSTVSNEENDDNPDDDDSDDSNDENGDDGNHDVTNNDVRPAADDHPAADEDGENDENDENDVEEGSESNNSDNNETNSDGMEPNPEKGLYRLEVHGRDALATVNSNLNTGLKFENFVLKDPEEEATFRVLTKPFRTPEGSLTLTPSLKLSFLKDTCIELNGSKFYDYKTLSDFFGTNGRVVPLYFEEIVVRIDGGVFLMRARARTIPHYYASQPFVHSVQSLKKKT